MPKTKAKRTVVLAGRAVNRVIARMAYEILELAEEPQQLALVGIHTAGVPLAQRLAKAIHRHEGLLPPVGTVDITLYRDDVGLSDAPRPVVGPTQIDFSLDGKTVVLVDDVLFTGRTVRAALDALTDFGRPNAIRLAVLIERGHRELPIQADVVGIQIKTGRSDDVRVWLKEINAGLEEEKVEVVHAAPAAEGDA